MRKLILESYGLMEHKSIVGYESVDLKSDGLGSIGINPLSDMSPFTLNPFIENHGYESGDMKKQCTMIYWPKSID